MEYDKTDEIAYLRNWKIFRQLTEAQSSNDAIYDTKTPADKDDEKNGVELLVNIYRILSHRIKSPKAPWTWHSEIGFSAQSHHVNTNVLIDNAIVRLILPREILNVEAIDPCDDAEDQTDKEPATTCLLSTVLLIRHVLL